MSQIQAGVAGEQEIGRPRRRREDERLVRGLGRYTSDEFPEDLCHAAMARTPYPHARILAIDTAAAAAMPGVLAVLTGADAAADGLGSMPHDPTWTGLPDAVLQIPDDFEVYVSKQSALPKDVVHHVGQAVAIVVAETAAEAATAAEMVEVDYEPLPAVIDPMDALADDAPQLWPDCPKNLALDCEVGDAAASDAAFATAAHVVSFEGRAHRVNGHPMEPRAVLGEYDPARDLYTLNTGSGRGVVRTRLRLAEALNHPYENCRVYFGDMGGNFGTRNAYFPEYSLVPWAARRVGRPVKWTAQRSECFASDYHARDLTVSAELALDAEGDFLAMRGRNVLNLGAHTVYFWPLRKGLSMMQGVYRIPAVHFRGQAVMTNTMPTAVYRSAGRPEAIYVIERLIEIAAIEHGFDQVELRRRNLIRPDEMPFANGVGVTYDNGEYEACMDRALELADWTGFAARRAEAAARGKKRGIAVANYIEVTSGLPRERAELKVCPDGMVDLVVGTASSGQGHETSFPQFVADHLQVPFDRIRFVANDSDRVVAGGGSHSGRSMRLISIAAGIAAERLVEKGKAVAAHMLQADKDDIAYADGVFNAPGGGSVDLWQAATDPESLPAALRGGLEAVGDITNHAGGFPYGAHVCEVEVDPDTGVVEIVAWSAVDDVGRAINPLILHGQAHGAIAQGVGQAMLEDVRYDPETGQLLTGSLMDYALPRADVLPSFKTEIMETPAASNPHGVRPGGEGGTTPALGLLVNAVVNALSEYGVRDIPMPVTSERVWQAIQASRRP